MKLLDKFNTWRRQPSWNIVFNWWVVLLLFMIGAAAHYIILDLREEAPTPVDLEAELQLVRLQKELVMGTLNYLFHEFEKAEQDYETQIERLEREIAETEAEFEKTIEESEGTPGTLDVPSKKKIMYKYNRDTGEIYDPEDGQVVSTTTDGATHEQGYLLAVAPEAIAVLRMFQHIAQNNLRPGPQDIQKLQEVLDKSEGK